MRCDFASTTASRSPRRREPLSPLRVEHFLAPRLPPVLSAPAALAAAGEMCVEDADEDVETIAEESRDLAPSPTASFSQTLAVFLSKDLWAGSIRKFVIYRLPNQLSNDSVI